MDHALARCAGLVGAEVAVTASLADQLPLPRAVVVVVAPDAAAESYVDGLVLAAAGMVGRGQPMTVAVTCPSPRRLGAGSAFSRYVHRPDLLPEAFVEAVAAGRRSGLTTATGSTVVLLQRFVPAVASAVVWARPDRNSPVLIDGRWGLVEERSAVDTVELPAYGVHETLVRKPTARLAMGGRTSTVTPPDVWQHRNSLGRDTTRQLAALSRDAAVAAGTALSLDIVISSRGPVVLRCRPSTP